VNLDSIQDSMPEQGQTPVAAATLDAEGLSCGLLEPLIARHLRALAPGEVLEIRSDREEAADGIRAWAWLSGHTLLGVEKEAAAHHARYFIRKNVR
jgi:TusA-related sulfurtransferase